MTTTEAVRLVRSGRRASRMRATAVSVALVGICFAAICLTSAVGSYPVPVAEVPAAVFGLGDPASVYVVRELRIPRSVVSLAVGFTFGLSGAIFQSLARNPLASPDIVGVSTGASLGAVLAIATVGQRTVAVPMAALAGAVAAAVVIVLFAWRRSLSPLRLILVGIGLQAMLDAAISLVQSRLDRAELEQAGRWLSGSVNALGWDHVRVVLLVLAVLAPALLAAARPLAVLQLGDAVARSAGLAATRWQAVLLLLGCAFCAVGVAIAGPVLLVGFLGPPIARRLTGSPGPALIASGLTSGTVLVLADLLARYGIGNLHLPVGLLTGALGAPVLLYLLLRRTREAR